MNQMTKQKRTLIRFVFISFGISIAIQSHKRQGEPTRVRKVIKSQAEQIKVSPSHPVSIATILND